MNKIIFGCLCAFLIGTSVLGLLVLVEVDCPTCHGSGFVTSTIYVSTNTTQNAPSTDVSMLRLLNVSSEETIVEEVETQCFIYYVPVTVVVANDGDSLVKAKMLATAVFRDKKEFGGSGFVYIDIPAKTTRKIKVNITVMKYDVYEAPAGLIRFQSIEVPEEGGKVERTEKTEKVICVECAGTRKTPLLKSILTQIHP